MIADVAFDVAVLAPFSYRVPDGWRVAAGQRVWAPLRGGARVGMITALREGDDPKLKPLAAVAEPGAILSGAQLDLVRWIAAESLTSVGATAAALLPPVVDVDGSGRGDRAARLLPAVVDAAADGWRGGPGFTASRGTPHRAGVASGADRSPRQDPSTSTTGGRSAAAVAPT
ncbi:MAG: hypothetical protein ACRELS_03570, partial [Candidatus Rokuibacteriota bacterium]